MVLAMLVSTASRSFPSGHDSRHIGQGAHLIALALGAREIEPALHHQSERGQRGLEVVQASGAQPARPGTVSQDHLGGVAGHGDERRQIVAAPGDGGVAEVHDAVALDVENAGSRARGQVAVNDPEGGIGQGELWAAAEAAKAHVAVNQERFSSAESGLHQRQRPTDGIVRRTRRPGQLCQLDQLVKR